MYWLPLPQTVWQCLLLSKAHQHHWGPCQSQQDSLQTSLVPIVLSILGLPISAIAPSAPTPFLVTLCSQRTFPGPGLLLPAAVDEHTEAAPQTHITHRELNLAQPPRPEIPASVKKGPVTSLAFTSVGLSPYPQDKACPAFGTWVNLKILQLKVSSIPHSRIMILLYHRKSMDLGCVIWLLG